MQIVKQSASSAPRHNSSRVKIGARTHAGIPSNGSGMPSVGPNNGIGAPQHACTYEDIALLVGGALAVAGAYEWQYSTDMQQHISKVNRDLDRARSDAIYATGLIDSLHAMTAQTEVGWRNNQHA